MRSVYMLGMMQLRGSSERRAVRYAKRLARRLAKKSVHRTSEGRLWQSAKEVSYFKEEVYTEVFYEANQEAVDVGISDVSLETSVALLRDT